MDETTTTIFRFEKNVFTQKRQYIYIWRIVYDDNDDDDDDDNDDAMFGNVFSCIFFFSFAFIYLFILCLFGNVSDMRVSDRQRSEFIKLN